MKTIKRLATALKLKLVFPSIAVLAVIILASFGIYKATQATVVVASDGKIETVKTHAKTVKDLFNKLGIHVSKHDDISEDLDAPIEDGMEIELIKAKRIMLTVDDQFSSYYSTAETVEQFLEEEDIEVTEHDELSHDLKDEITEDIHIQLIKAFPIEITDGTEKQTVWTTGGTVEKLLNEHNINVNKHDQVKPDLKEQLSEDRDITIVRITYKEEEKEEVIDYQTEKIEDDQLEKGKEKVVTKGKEGKLVKTYRIKLKNGEKVAETLEKEEIKEEPTNEVIAVGTKEPEPEVVQLAKEEPKKQQKPLSNDKEFTMQATAYTANCSGCSGITATGINLKNNPNMKVVAVDPNLIPLGSRVWVEGYGEAIAADRGGSIRGNRIDVHVPSESAAYSFGTKTVKVKVLD